MAQTLWVWTGLVLNEAPEMAMRSLSQGELHGHSYVSNNIISLFLIESFTTS